MNAFNRRELEYRHTTERMRQAVKYIYGSCVLCGGVRALSCHHWWYPYKTCKNNPCSVALVNIVLVCRACHKALHAMQLHVARMKILPIVAAKLRTSPQDLRTILEGHCARRHVLDYSLTEL